MGGAGEVVSLTEPPVPAATAVTAVVSRTEPPVPEAFFDELQEQN